MAACACTRIMIAFDQGWPFTVTPGGKLACCFHVLVVGFEDINHVDHVTLHDARHDVGMICVVRDHVDDPVQPVNL